jgi:hypothetical protein
MADVQDTPIQTPATRLQSVALCAVIALTCRSTTVLETSLSHGRPYRDSSVWPPINITQLHGSLSRDCCLALHFPPSCIAAQSKGRASCNILSVHPQVSLAPSDHKPLGNVAHCKQHYALCYIQGLTWQKFDIKSLFCYHKSVHQCVLQSMPFWKWVACHSSHHHDTDSLYSKQPTPLCYAVTAHDIVTIHSTSCWRIKAEDVFAQRSHITLWPPAKDHIPKWLIISTKNNCVRMACRMLPLAC